MANAIFPHHIQPLKDDFFSITAKVFPGALTLKVIVFTPQLSDKMSSEFKSASENVMAEVSVSFFVL